MKKIVFTEVGLLVNSFQVRSQDQPSLEGKVTKQYFLSVNGSFPELGNLGFYKDLPITEAEALGGVSIAFVEKAIKADFSKTSV